MRELKLYPIVRELRVSSRTLPRVRELKLECNLFTCAELRRTLPRVRELKQEDLDEEEQQDESHPSQGA